MSVDDYMYYFSRQKSDSSFEHSLEIDLQHQNKKALIEANYIKPEEVETKVE